MTKNLVNGKRYIGMCSYGRRHRIIETYLGSGKAIKRAIAKYGANNFCREILFEAFSFQDLIWAEKQLIEEFDAVKSRDFYNISPGGRASLGFTGKKHTLERNKKVAEKLKGHSVTDEVRLAVSKTGKRVMQVLANKVVTCPHCKKSGKLGPMHLWHFEKCHVKRQADQSSSE
jgi:group I intron endonuclease